MIHRIVQLQLKVEHIESFLDVYARHILFMRNLEECHSLELFKHPDINGLFFTISVWESEEALEKYRNSEYFKDIWAQVKPWFDAKAQAWSLKKLEF